MTTGNDERGPLQCLRTPADWFSGLADFDYPVGFTCVGEGVRMAHVEVGPADGPPIVLLHGEPTWGYLYRHMIDPLTDAGYRVLVPDLVGFGRSDKPTRIADHSTQRHVDWMRAWFDALGLTDAVLFGQDWGALIGLRLVAEQPARFSRVFVGNGFLLTGDEPARFLIGAWRAFAQYSPLFPVGAMLQAGTRRWLSRAERAAYVAPFPDPRYMAGPRALPRLLPVSSRDPAHRANRAAWTALETFESPFHTCFSDGDPVTRGGAKPFRERVPGAASVPHKTVAGAGHFLQEDAGEEIAHFMRDCALRS
ncbi:haloalkane dehalogenase [Salinisphaera hydrothermalis]|uniref:haloalkane dehalogenase n=1 Tax=Salinisphaera hydrothermalis TaxID=563188 RepID=UPI00334263EA